MPSIYTLNTVNAATLRLTPDTSREDAAVWLIRIADSAEQDDDDTTTAEVEDMLDALEGIDEKTITVPEVRERLSRLASTLVAEGAAR